MNAALFYLHVRSVRGRIVRTLLLLKQPKYLVGVLVFVAWMTFWIGGSFWFDPDAREVDVEFANADLFFRVMGEAVPAAQLAAALVLALLVSLWWLVPWSRMALNLSEAEIHILTPMPVKRRHLIQYATLKGQPGILFGCLMMTIFLGSGGFVSRLGWYASFWLLLSIWDMHSKGRALWLHRQQELPAEHAWRNRGLLVVAIVVFWVVVGGAVFSLVTQLMTLRPAPEQEALDFVRQTLARIAPDVQSGVLAWALAPFVWVLAPLFAHAPGVEGSQLLAAALIPLAILLVHNEWVVRSQTKFEEAALAHARREADKRASGSRYWKTSMRSRRRAPFALQATGAPAVGIVWKNAMIVTRFSLRSLALFGVALVIVATLMPLIIRSFEPLAFVIMSVGFMTMLFAPLTASQSYRNDFRADLLRIEMVRPWPIEGWKLFAAEAAAPTVFAIMTTLLGAALVLAIDLTMTLDRWFGGTAGEDLRITPQNAAVYLGVPPALMMPLIVAGVVPLLIALSCLSTALQNLVTLLFPGWVHLGSDKQQGAAAFGQNMLTFFGHGLAALLCVLPAALLVAAITTVQWFAFGIPIVAWEFPIFGIVAATPVLAAAMLIVRAGGRVWDNLDPSREILEGSV